MSHYRDENDEKQGCQRVHRDARASAALLSLLQLHHDVDDVFRNTVREKRGRIWDARKKG